MYFDLNFKLGFFLIQLFKVILSNEFKCKSIYLVFKNQRRKRKGKFMWALNFSKFFKIKINVNLKKKTFFWKKKKPLNRILKVKKLTGLFKRRVNIRKTVLKKKSFFFKTFIKWRKKKKVNVFYRRRYFRNKYNYRVYNIDMSRKRKEMFFKNRRIIRLFLKKKNVKRQNKLNSYLINLLNKDSKNIINLLEFKLHVILIKSNLLNNLKDVDFFINKGLIYVNNNATYNINYVVKISDTIKIINKKHYYYFYRVSLNDSLFSMKKINWAYHRFKKKNRFNNFFPKVYRWIYSGINFGFDVPSYLEVDYVNLTVLVLIKSFDVSMYDYVTIKFINLYLTRLYNWNYIN